MKQILFWLATTLALAQMPLTILVLKHKPLAFLLHATCIKIRDRFLRKGPKTLIAGDSNMVRMDNLGYRVGGIRNFFNVMNKGKSGLLFFQIVAEAIATLKLLRHSPSYIIITGGCNDARRRYRSALGCMDALIEEARKRGTIVVLVLSTYFEEKCARLNRLVREANEEKRLAFADTDVIVIDPNEFLSDPRGFVLPQYSNDGLHLNKEGENLLLKKLAPYL